METQLRVVGDRKPVTVEPQREVSDEELLKAENELREEIRRCVKRIEATYWDLARGLYDVYDGVPGGYRALVSGEGSRQDRKELFKKWGYENFGDYCEKEVGIRKRTAENLRYAYYWFAVKLDLPEEIIEEIQTLGRSKVYQLAGFVKEDNVTVWMDKARELTHDDLKKAIKQARIAAAGKGDGEEKDQEAIFDSDSADDKDELPKPEELHTVQTALYDGQWNTWQDALKRAKSLTGSDKIGHNLEMICQDFLANNDFGADAKGDRDGWLAKVERQMGVHLVAVDPSSGKPIYGGELMWRIVQDLKDADSDE